MTAIITGADGGIGSEITLAVAKAGYHVIMGCLQPKAAEAKRQYIINKSANKSIDILPLDLSSFQSVNDFSRNIRNKTDNIKLLMNNAGTMNGKRIILENGLEKTVCINCVGPHLLTRNLIPIMSSGSRVVNMVSLTYTWANLQLPDNPSISKHSSKRSRNLKQSLLIRSDDKLSQTFLMTSINSFLVCGFASVTALFMIAHSSSIGLRSQSGELAGQSAITSINLSNQSIVAAEVCERAPSCMNNHPYSPYFLFISSINPDSRIFKI
ncbi:SDR family NAD(P)-dependent oxidoreductase [Histomonas meleagridis]|nr:SDR family NAD(P)-dependent oxidoreductase [Histomonas meleagridis]